GVGPEGGSALCVELRAENHRLEQLLRRESHGPDGHDRARQNAPADREDAAARSGRRRAAPDPRPGGHRQGGGRAMSAQTNEQITPEQVEQLLRRGPFHQWLGIKVLKLEADGIELKATWREEWVVNPDRRYTHGGGLAALVDLAADWAMVTRTGRGVPTIDIRVAYHAAAMPGDLIASGRIVKWGNQFSVSEAQVFDEAGKLLASGRGTYLTTPPKT